MHPVVVGPVHNIKGYLREGGWRGDKAAAGLGAPGDLVAPYALRVVEGGEDAGELDTRVGTILVGAVVATAVALPLVGAMEVEVEFLATTEGVALGETDTHLGTVVADGLADGIALDIEVIGLVEDAVQGQVEAVGTRTGRELEVGGGEDTRGVDLAGRLEVVGVTELLAWAQAQVLEDDTRTDGGVIPIEVDGQVAALNTVGELLASHLAEVHGEVADIPFVEGALGQTVGQLEA